MCGGPIERLCLRPCGFSPAGLPRSTDTADGFRLVGDSKFSIGVNVSMIEWEWFCLCMLSGNLSRLCPTSRCKNKKYINVNFLLQCRKQIVSLRRASKGAVCSI